MTLQHISFLSLIWFLQQPIMEDELLDFTDEKTEAQRMD